MNSFLINWIYITTFTLITLWLVGCSSYKVSAPITSMHEISNVRIFLNIRNHSHLAKVDSKDFILYKRSYHNIPYGSYDNSIYTIKPGDTMFYVSWISGNDLRDIAENNNIQAPYNLYVGQTIQLKRNCNHNSLLMSKDRKSKILTSLASSYITITNIDSSLNKTYSKNPDTHNINLTDSRSISKTTNTSSAISLHSSTRSSPLKDPSTAWCWITEGKVIDYFSSAEGGNKGVDIAGILGQPVLATSDGRVVYAGSALRGYGNLIIIKHNHDYLSAYAHNDTILVREQQEVKSGQKIATMGSTGTISVRLHFEIRYKGKPVNPLYYLPQK